MVQKRSPMRSDEVRRQAQEETTSPTQNGVRNALKHASYLLRLLLRLFRSVFNVVEIDRVRRRRFVRVNRRHALLAVGRARCARFSSVQLRTHTDSILRPTEIALCTDNGKGVRHNSELRKDDSPGRTRRGRHPNPCPASSSLPPALPPRLRTFSSVEGAV